MIASDTRLLIALSGSAPASELWQEGKTGRRTRLIASFRGATADCGAVVRRRDEMSAARVVGQVTEELGTGRKEWEASSRTGDSSLRCCKYNT